MAELISKAFQDYIINQGRLYSGRDTWCNEINSTKEECENVYGGKYYKRADCYVCLLPEYKVLAYKQLYQ